MTGSAADQQALLTGYAEYTGAAELHRTLGGVWLGVEADRKHADLFIAAMMCGFDPAGLHKHVSCLDWAGRRVRLIAAILPNHAREIGRRAA